MAKIILMEDDSEQARLLAALLSNGGHDVEIAYTGGEAWASLRAKPFDLLITDMQVPSAPGIRESDGGLALIIRARENTDPNLPEWISKLRIIAISGSGNYGKGALQRAGVFGADLCLQKPVGPAELLDAVTVVTRDQ